VGADLAGAADVGRVRVLMEECLAAKGGEVSARTRARRLGGTWLQLSPSGRQRFLALLAEDFAVDHDAVADLAAELTRVPVAERPDVERRLRRALSASRRGLVRQLSAVPGGMKLVVDMRAELLDHLGPVGPDPTTETAALETAALELAALELAALNEDMFDLLLDWFDVGFLELRRISWDSPAALLEKVIAYEAVHRIDSWADLRNRLDSDRRCFGFFHPRMPDEPLIFVEVALARGVASSVQELLDLDAPQSALPDVDTAVFYSISNTQAGLRGVGFGDFLIKRVVEDLQRELPTVRVFVTLSPLPGFRRWFDTAEVGAVAGAAAITVDQVLALRTQLGTMSGTTPAEERENIRAELLRAAAGYLVRAKRGVAPLDPVARFHLGNGARVERLNWQGDSSPKGWKESYGVMVNYRYELSHIEANHEAFASEHAVVTAKAITEMLDPPRRR
jgi:malonyl-CoA decarboxylase